MLEKLVNKMFEIKSSATKSQVKLIDYLMNSNSQEIIYMSITELSEATDVGEATILRFCRALGYKGYQDFKLDLARGLSNVNKEKQDSFLDTIANEMISTINICKSNIDPKSLERAVEVITNSKRISIFGSGSSFIPAKELFTSLLRIGISSNVEVDPHMQNVLISTFTKEDCLIIFSVSGCSIDSIDVLDIAKENGVKTIIITSYEKSPMAKMADIVIRSVKNESPINGGSTLSKIAQFYVVSVLVSAIRNSNKEKYEKNYETTSKSVVRKLI